MEVRMSRRRSGKLVGLLIHKFSRESGHGETRGLLLCNTVKEDNFYPSFIAINYFC